MAIGSLFIRRACAAIVVVAAASVAVADSNVPTLNVSEEAQVGALLVDGEGMSLYLFTRDEDGVSTCEGDCAQAWPPLLVDGQVAFGSGVDLGLIGTTERADGSMQLTYGGWPLYGFVQDSEPGDIAGHGANGVWFLISPDGELIAADEGADADSALEEQMRIGSRVYSRICASCHGAEGDEALVSHAVPLAGNQRAIENANRMLRRIVHGGNYMPGFGNELSDEEVAAVATFVRNSWGNDEPPVAIEEVVDVR